MKTSKYAIASVCMILSMLVTLQAKSVMKINEKNSTSKIRAEELQVALQKEQTKNIELYNELVKYRTQIDEYSQKAKEDGGLNQILSSRLEETMIAAGLTDVAGPGLTITLKDSIAPRTQGVDENNFLIHDEDLLRVINEINDAGAEAISINDERLLATSEIRCTGATVSVNNNRYSAPYVIKVIGNADEMERALNIRSGVVDILKEWGIEISIKKQENVLIKAYNGAINHKYAKTQETGDAK